jgi:hypothetical protein
LQDFSAYVEGQVVTVYYTSHEEKPSGNLH